MFWSMGFKNKCILEEVKVSFRSNGEILKSVLEISVPLRAQTTLNYASISITHNYRQSLKYKMQNPKSLKSCKDTIHDMMAKGMVVSSSALAMGVCGISHCSYLSRSGSRWTISQSYSTTVNYCALLTNWLPLVSTQTPTKQPPSEDQVLKYKSI